LSTLKAYFEGKRELFEGLEIAELEKDWTEYPVIYLDFNRENYCNLDAVYVALDITLKMSEKKYGVTDIAPTPASRLSELIRHTHESTGKKVVVLVDEYDKALVSTMDKPALNDEIREVFKGFYGVLKSEDAHLRFVFLTGVTKFSKVSVFSDLNHLDDISMDEEFAGICGISETELMQIFQPEIEALARRRKMTYDAAVAEIKKRYDGYHFAKECEDMYNPFSVLNTFKKLDFANYWFKTGTPTVLVKHLKNIGYDIRKLENGVSIAANSIMDYRVEYSNYIPLLYQSGYLTVKKYRPEIDSFVLGFPNEEVKYGFLNELLPAYVPLATSGISFSANDFAETFLEGDIEEMMIQLKAFFASIPYDVEYKRNKDEKYYQLVFYLLFALMGQFVRTEVKSAAGRADAVVWTADTIYIFEFKMDDNATAEAALAQINSKDYAIPYSADHRETVKIGVEFSVTDNGVKRWIIEKE
jgi:hypothetical protein